MTSAAQTLDWIRDGQRGLGTRAPEWLTSHRRDALEHFEATGFPSTREEAWRFTNVGPIASTVFDLAAPDAEGAEALAAANEIRDSAATAVVVNGCFDETLSAYGALPLGVVVEGLAVSLEADGSSARDIALDLDIAGLPFAALNAAFLEDGVHIVIPEGAVLSAPIQVVVATLPGARPVMAHPRLDIEARAQSQARSARSEPGRGARCRSAFRAVIAGRGSTTTSSPRAARRSRSRTPSGWDCAWEGWLERGSVPKSTTRSLAA